MLWYKADNYVSVLFFRLIDIFIFFFTDLIKRMVFCAINVTVAFLKRDRSGAHLSSVFEFTS